MIEILEENERVYNYLEQERAKNPRLRYTYRKSNYNNRLAEGYWFYGTDEYLALSFWSGMDWKNRTPNISFIISRTGRTHLEISVSDSDIKRDFIESYFLNRVYPDGYHLQIKKQGQKYIIEYDFPEDQPLKSLDAFINGQHKSKSDKDIIDYFISTFSKIHFKETNRDDIIGFLEPSEFKSRQVKVEKYRTIWIESHTDEIGLLTLNELPNKLVGFSIQNFGPLNFIEVKDISIKNQWIFITGENGSGKTCVLRALATSIGQRILKKSEIELERDFKVQLELTKDTQYYNYERFSNRNITRRGKPVTNGLAMYGPYRLDITEEKISNSAFKNELLKEQSFKSLFDPGIKLLNIDKQFEIWRRDLNELKRFEKRMYFIKNVFTDIVPNLHNILFTETDGNKKTTKYLFRKNDNDGEVLLTWSQLSSGTKSIFAMLGDIMIRLYNQQKSIIDSSELTGVVIIDEIDIHLHPQAQRDIVINLTKAFPNVQFIASTHSPIPLLGAPDNTVFLKVSRDFGEGISVERLFEIEEKIGNLLPNIIYTSTVFGLQNLISVANKNISEIMTEDNMLEAEEFIRTKKKLDIKPISDLEFLKKLKNSL